MILDKITNKTKMIDKVLVECDLKVDDKCKGKYYCDYRSAQQNFTLHFLN